MGGVQSCAGKGETGVDEFTGIAKIGAWASSVRAASVRLTTRGAWGDSKGVGPGLGTKLPSEPIGNLAASGISVGIDFGTARSGYAFAFGADNPQLQFTWPGEVVQQAKTITALLYDTQSWKPVAWGMEAYKQYVTVPPREQSRYAYLESFKLLLSDTAESNMAIPLPPGCPHAREVVIGHFLAFLQKHLQEHLRKTYGDSIMSKASINYCITIPAGWSDSAKHLTRRAAELAGIVPGSGSGGSQLTLLYEPEAAALTTCAQPNVSVEIGEKFLILDAGGGTVDITMHVVEQRSGVKVLSEAAYRACVLQGSKVVDSNFREWLGQQVGPMAFLEWQKAHISDFLAVMSEWEQLKRAFTGGTAAGYSVLRLPFSLLKIVSAAGRCATLYEDKLHVTDTTMAAIFDPAVNKMIETVQEMVTRAGFKPDKLLLVGGFGSSLYLRSRLESTFGTRMGDLLAPPFGYSAVVEGAVRYLQRPKTIVSRISTMTYGVQVITPWEEAVMPESAREWSELYQRWVTRSGFLKAVGIGQKVDLDDTFIHEITPARNKKAQKITHIKVFSTVHAEPKLVTPDMEHVATIEVPINLTRVKSAEDYKIQLVFKLGHTEMEVEARDTVQNKAVTIKLDFASGSSGGTAGVAEAQRMHIRV